MTTMPTTDPAAGEQRPTQVAAPRRGRHPVDLRLSLPLPGRRFYCTIVAGRERRAADRRRQERRRHPLRTIGNILFFALAAIAFYAAAALGILLYSSVLTL
jgi:hypothetical protein